MNEYYGILELTPKASKAQIKSAYRRLAKKYHPDISKEPDAEEKFIAITEAYEYLLEGPPVTQSTSYSEEDSFETQEEQRRQRAREYAHMRYDKFKQNNQAFQRSWYFRLVRFAVYAMIFVGYAFSLAMFVSPLLAWLLIKDSRYVYVSVVAVLLSFNVYKYTRGLQTGVRPYFENYD